MSEARLDDRGGGIGSDLWSDDDMDEGASIESSVDDRLCQTDDEGLVAYVVVATSLFMLCCEAVLKVNLRSMPDDLGPSSESNLARSLPSESDDEELRDGIDPAEGSMVFM